MTARQNPAESGRNRVVRLLAIGRVVTLGRYVRAVRRAKASPDIEFRNGLTTWWPTSGADIMRQFRQGMHQRISAAIPYSERGTL